MCFIYIVAFSIWTLQIIRTMRYPEKWGINHPSYLSEGETISSFDMMRMVFFGLYSFEIVSMFPKYMDWKPKITHRTPVWRTQPIKLQCFGLFWWHLLRNNSTFWHTYAIPSDNQRSFKTTDLIGDSKLTHLEVLPLLGHFPYSSWASCEVADCNSPRTWLTWPIPCTTSWIWRMSTWRLRPTRIY